ncbi:Protein kinase, catalytic domain-containing protein, partial [Cynara cardunculus var. scolymus]
LSDARSLGHLEICKILEAHGGTDPGAFGEVYKVKWRGTEVAAKTIRSSIASNETVRKAFLKELALWQTLRHPNIVQFLGVLTDSDRLIFLTEYLQNVDEAGRLKVTDFGLSKIAQEKDMFQGRPSNREEPPEHVADKRAYEDSRPPLPSYYPERIR